MRRLVLVAGAVGVFALLAHGVLAQGSLTQVDREVLLFMVAHRTAWLTRLALTVGTVHQTTVVLAATALAAALLAWRRHAYWALMLIAVPTGMLANAGLKQVIGRARPVLENPLLRLETLSFPSGHAIAATLFYGALCLVVLAHARTRRVRMAAVAGALGMITFVAGSRVYLGVHYLADVLAGISFGIAWLALALEVLARWERRVPRRLG